MTIADQLRRMEEALADPEVRKEMGVLDSILHPEFREIGASGTIYNRKEIMTLLADEADFSVYEITDFSVEELSAGHALVTFRIPERIAGEMRKPGSMRSSIWALENNIWQLKFHQGTRIP